MRLRLAVSLLEDYMSETISVPPETLRDSVSSSFQLPPAQRPDGPID